MDDVAYSVGFAYVALLGACVGSFVNVVVARLPRDMSVVRPRSRCMACGASIAWYDNVPLLSYLVLRGRCRACAMGYGPRYVLVEAMMAGLYAALYARLGVTFDLLVWLPIAAALVAITFLDIDHWWVPDVITYPCMLWAMLTAWLPGRPGAVAAALGLLPALMLFALGWGFSRLAGKEGLGLGDVKLLALLGLALGLADSLTALVLASMQGALIGAVVVFAGGHRSHAEPVAPALQDPGDDWQPDPHAVPFGPFLCLGALEVLLLPEVFGGWVSWLRGGIGRAFFGL